MGPDTSILLADSDQIAVELGKTYLRKTGARLFTCHDGEMAWEIICRERPDLVLMSATMPGLDGIECCRLVKADAALHAIPVVLTLVSGKGENVESCARAGCDDVLLKPIDRKTFFSTLKKFVNLEKRNAPRFKSRFSIHCVRDKDNGSDCNVFDISTGGLFLQASPLLPVDTVVQMDFVLPVVNVEICCRGRVAWLNKPEAPNKTAFPPGMGVEFVGLCAEGKQAIHDYLQKEHVTRIFKSAKA
ncbi:MAG: response regulator [Geobacteraceae bacterium]|nr:response regulator [Geobacteraceae bacterium]